MVTSRPLLHSLLLILGRCVLSSGPIFVWFGTISRSGRFFPKFRQFFVFAGQSCCLLQFGAPHLIQSTFRTLFVFFRVFDSFFFYPRVLFSFLLLSLLTHSSFRTYICGLCRLSRHVSFFDFFFRSMSPVVFPITEKNFEASSSAAVISSNSQFFSNSRIRFQVSAAESPGSFYRLKKSAQLPNKM